VLTISFTDEPMKNHCHQPSLHLISCFPAKTQSAGFPLVLQLQLFFKRQPLWISSTSHFTESDILTLTKSSTALKHQSGGRWDAGMVICLGKVQICIQPY